MNQHGGKRAGAGRKPVPVEYLKVAKTYKLTREIVRYLAEQENATATIERAITSTKAFREWRAKE